MYCILENRFEIFNNYEYFFWGDGGEWEYNFTLVDNNAFILSSK